MAARETGVVRQRLDGDTAAAQRLNSIARTQLGILKELMAFGGLQQLSRTVRLGDGTEIFVQSVFGQDTMRITPPVTAVEVSGAEEAITQQTAYVYVAGFGYDAAKAGYRAYRWKVSVTGGGLLSEDDLGISVFNGSQSLAMSDAGDVVVVNTTDPLMGVNRVFRWTAASGPIDLLANTPSSGLSISSDASCVLVHDVDALSGVSGMYRWTAASGFIRLVGTDVFTYSAPKISSDGKSAVVIGNDSISGSDYVYYWTESGGTVALSPNAPITVNSGIESFLSGDGSTVVFSAYDGNVFQNRAYRWDATGFLDLGISQYNGHAAVSVAGDIVSGTGHDSTLGQNRAYVWSAQSGIADTSVPNAYSVAPSMTPDGTALAIAGLDSALGQTRTYLWRRVAGALDLGIPSISYGSMVSQDGTVVSFTGFDAVLTSKNRAFRWTASPGAINLGSFVSNGNSFASALSPDGAVVVGDSISAVGQVSCAWMPLERIQLGSSTAPPNGPKAVTKVFYE